MLDRCGDRKFTPEPIRNRHPVVVTDSITGRPVLCFGGGGLAPNALDNIYNGSLYPAAGGGNDAAMFKPNVGWSVAAKLRVPAPSATANNITFGASTGGCVLGSRGDELADASSFVDIDQSTGYFRGYNNRSVGTAGQLFSQNVNYRDGLWHDYVISYNANTGTYSDWVDGVSAGPTTDVPTDPLSAIPQTGSTVSTGGLQTRFGGFVACLYWLPGPVLANATARATMRALMATR